MSSSINLLLSASTMDVPKTGSISGPFPGQTRSGPLCGASARRLPSLSDFDDERTSQ